MKLENIVPMYYFIDVKPFQYNDTYKIKKLLYNNPLISNICEQLYYGIVTFENNKHDSWNIDFQEMFNINTNIIIIKIKENLKFNPQNNKYLVIYQNITKAQNSYGCFWINSENEVKSMHVSIEYTFEDLLQIIIKDINLWSKIKLYNAISGIHKKFNVIEIDNIYKEYIETYRSKSIEEWESLSKVYNLRYRI